MQPLSLQNVSPAGIDHENDTSTLVVNQPLHPPAGPGGVQTTTIVGGSRPAEPAEAEAGRTSKPTAARSKLALRSKTTSRPEALITQPESVDGARDSEIGKTRNVSPMWFQHSSHYATVVLPIYDMTLLGPPLSAD